MCKFKLGDEVILANHRQIRKVYRGAGGIVCESTVSQYKVWLWDFGYFFINKSDDYLLDWRTSPKDHQ